MLASLPGPCIIGQMTTVRDLLLEGKHRLSSEATDHVDAPSLEAEILLSEALDVSRAHLFAHPEEEVDNKAIQEFRSNIEQRHQGTPIAYLTGEREFWSLPLKVSPAVLIPRPETEVLVEAVLARIPPNQSCRIVDVGTGSGAIALAIASERPDCEVHACDISSEALEIAKENARNLGISNVSFHQGSWLEPLSGRFDLVVSNPPYVAEGDPHLYQGDLRFEPGIALASGENGLEAIRTITKATSELLVGSGWLCFEHGHKQAEDCAEILGSNGFQLIETLRDLEGTKRVTLGRRA